jgi:osmotically-inducible protein OsmY
MKFAGVFATVPLILLVSGCTESYRSPSPPATYGRQVISSPGSTTTASAPQVYSTPGASASSAPADRELEERVRQVLRTDNSIVAFTRDIQVAANNGAVTLTGTVVGDAQRQSVDNAVRNISGVTSVFDRLQVVPVPTGATDSRSYPPADRQPPPAQPPAQNLATGDIFNLYVHGLNATDSSLAERVLQGLRSDQALASLFPSVNINVSGGRVVLQGRVQTEQQKQTIASVVQRAAGATAVDNQLLVTGP